jgi:hypothetical protein
VEDTKRTRWMGCLTSRRASGTLGHLSLITQTHTSEGGTDRMGHTTQCTHPPTHIRRLFGAQHEWWEGEWAEETVPRRELRQLRLQTWWCGLVLVVWAAKRRCCVCVCVFCERPDLEFLSDWSDSSFHTRDHLENATTQTNKTRQYAVVSTIQPGSPAALANGEPRLQRSCILSVNGRVTPYVRIRP